MTVSEILKVTEHRPWDVPKQKWKFYQEWNNAIFIHWKIDKNELRKFIPQELKVDLFDGEAWVSMVAFTMEKIRPKNLLYFTPISNFDEINIRTYVSYNNKPGVYFLSIEGGKSLSCKIAKSISELPYRYSKMKRTKNSFISNNSEFNDYLNLKYNIGAKVNEKSKLDKWLTERYALFHNTNNTLNEYEIHHIEWPINEIAIKQLDYSYKRFKKLLTNKPNKVQYSRGVQVIAWSKKKNKFN
jgi:hypothetical protein